jgi:hypothetical protein
MQGIWEGNANRKAAIITAAMLSPVYLYKRENII